MVKVAIVEDEEESRVLLEQYMQQYEAEYGGDFKVTFFMDGEQIAHDYRPVYDIILMDIQMKSMDGMSAAELIRRRDPEVIIIFITQARQYALRGYAVDALDFVLKPVTYFAFSKRMNRAMDRIVSRTAHYVIFSVKGGAKKINVSQIRYIESQGHTIILHMQKEDLAAGGATMREMEEKLVPFGFSRCNKGYLVNLDFVDAVENGCALLGKDRLLISRGRKTPFMEDLANHIGGRTK